MSKKQSKRGRPTKYRPEMCDTAIECGRKGMTANEIAGQLGISRDTLWRWTKENKEFSDAINLATDFAMAWWEGKGREGTFGEIQGFNATSYVFQMGNRFRGKWADVRRSEVTGADGGAIKVEDSSATDKVRKMVERIAERSGETGGAPK